MIILNVHDPVDGLQKMSDMPLGERLQHQERAASAEARLTQSSDPSDKALRRTHHPGYISKGIHANAAEIPAPKAEASLERLRWAGS